MKKLLVATTIAAITLTTPTTVFAKANVRYSTGIVTGAKSIQLQTVMSGVQSENFISAREPVFL